MISPASAELQPLYFDMLQDHLVYWPEILSQEGDAQALSSKTPTLHAIQEADGIAYHALALGYEAV